MPTGIYSLEKRKGLFQKGHAPTYIKRGEEHCGWKGSKISYWGIHKWITRNFGQPSVCENCKKDNLFGRQIHWANISQKYKRDKKDWKRLCQSCHKKYDKSCWKNISR